MSCKGDLATDAKVSEGVAISQRKFAMPLSTDTGCLTSVVGLALFSEHSHQILMI